MTHFHCCDEVDAEEAFERGRTEGYWQGVRDGQHKSPELDVGRLQLALDAVEANVGFSVYEAWPSAKDVAAEYARRGDGAGAGDGRGAGMSEPRAARFTATTIAERTELLALLADLVSFHVENAAGECSWCEADNPARTTDHRPSCPWRRAQEIVHASR